MGIQIRDAKLSDAASIALLISLGLMKNCEAWAKEMNASAIYLNCGNRAERERAHLFYKQMRFVHKSSGYVKTLD